MVKLSRPILPRAPDYAFHNLLFGDKDYGLSVASAPTSVIALDSAFLISSFLHDRSD
jgi:hypothetical protein